MMNAEEKQYKCEECNQSFKLSTTLKVHNMLHPDQKSQKRKEGY